MEGRQREKEIEGEIEREGGLREDLERKRCVLEGRPEKEIGGEIEREGGRRGDRERRRFEGK